MVFSKKSLCFQPVAQRIQAFYQDLIKKEAQKWLNWLNFKN